LGFNKQLGPRSIASILTSTWCNQLEFLDLRWTAAGDEGASLIASTDRLDNLRRLDLSNTGLGPTGARALVGRQS
jgi:Leucine Rich repeat